MNPRCVEGKSNKSIRRSLLEKAESVRNNHPKAGSLHHYLWGEEDVHVGMYDSNQTSINQASQATVQRMAEMLPPDLLGKKILDIGSGYGGSARYLARRNHCHVDCLNPGEVENSCNLFLTIKQNLTQFIQVHQGDFEHLPFTGVSYDVVWSQDALYRSADRSKVLQEVDRVLKPGGCFVFTDTMQADECPDEVLENLLKSVQSRSLASPSYYFREGAKLEWKMPIWQDLSEHWLIHYRQVKEELSRQRNKLKTLCDEDYMEDVRRALNDWIKAGDSGYVRWGIFLFRKAEL